MNRGGTVTFVFTDIEGSTRLVRHFKDRWPEVRSRHRQIVREAFEAHDGDEIDTQGDSFFYVFGRARDAALAAADAQRTLSEHEWPEDGAVRIRIGLHTGEPVVSEEGYHGIGVHRAARIMAAGHGGQVLLSEATAAVLRDEEVAGVGVRDLGVHRLKDLDRPEHVYQLVAEGLAPAFPKIRTAGMQRPYHRRPVVIGAAAGVLAAAAAIPVFALAGGSGGGQAFAAVKDNAVGVVDAQSRKISAVAPDVQSPVGVAVGAGSIWVTSGGNALVRIDPASHQVSQTITVGSGPRGVAVHGDDVWVANSLDGTVSRVSAQTNQETAHYDVGNTPIAVAIGEGKVWVTNGDDGTITELDATSGDLVRTIQVGSPVHGIAYGGRKLWVSDPVDNALLEVAPGSGPVNSINVGSGPTAVAYRNGTVWVANNLDGTVWSVDANRGRVTNTYQVGAAPNGIAVTPDAVWVSDEGTGKLTRIDRKRSTTSATLVGGRPEGLAALDGSLWVGVQAAGNAHRGGTLRLVGPSGSILQNFDPTRSYLTSDWQLLAVTADGLVGFKRVGGSDGNTLVPDLAVRLPQPTANGTSYTFQLRKGIRSSNGHELQASDVRASFERIFKIGGPRPDFYSGIVGAKACKPGKSCDLARGILVDERAGTVTFKLAAPDPEFLYKLALPLATVVPAGTWSGKADRPVPATGPYYVRESKANRFARLVRNPHFHVWSRAAQPEGLPDAIVVKVGSTPDAQTRAVEKGRVDWLTVGPSHVDAAATEYPGQLHITPSPSTLFIQLNTRRRPFNSLDARKALAYAIDRKLAAGPGGGLHTAPTCVLIPPNFPAYRPYCPYVARPGIADSGPDISRALALVSRSGTKGALVRTFRIRIGSADFGPLDNELVRTLRLLGYRVSVRTVKDVNAYFTHIFGVDRADAIGSGWAADYPTPSNFMVGNLACVQHKMVCDPALDRRMRELTALQARDPQRANEEWTRLDEQVTDRALVIPVASPKSVDFVSKRVGNFEHHPVYGMLIDQLWLR